MDFDQLVRTITEQVLKQLHATAQKNCVMVLAARDADLTAKVHTLLQEDTNVYFWGENMGTKTPTRYIIPFLSCSGMAELATGNASDIFLAEVLRLALLGTHIEVLQFEYKQYSQTAPEALYSLYESYEETLSTYGIKEFAQKQPETVRVRETLITENMVTAAHAKDASVLWVSPKAIVTPLAQEAAKNLKITILKQ